MQILNRTQLKHRNRIRGPASTITRRGPVVPLVAVTSVEGVSALRVVVVRDMSGVDSNHYR